VGGSQDGAGPDENLDVERPGHETSRSRSWILGHDDALNARRAGQIISLKEALKVANPGNAKVIEVKLFRYAQRAVYRFKLRHEDGSIDTMRVNALTGELDGLFR
jgi:uncharacterized membrane protein YkoI